MRFALLALLLTACAPSDLFTGVSVMRDVYSVGKEPEGAPPVARQPPQPPSVYCRSPTGHAYETRHNPCLEGDRVIPETEYLQFLNVRARGR